MKTYQNYINGKWVSSKSGKHFEKLNPATLKTIGKFQASNSQDVEAAVQAAEHALSEWKSTPAPRRGEILLEIAQQLKKNKLRLGKLVSSEMGKVLKEALGDVQEAIDVTEYMAGEGRRLFGITTPSELKNKMSYTIRIPIGVVGLITPWNFPFAIPAWKIMPALIGGNTIVFKPSSDTPLCAIELVKLIEKAGLPKGVLNLVTGSAEEVGKTIIKHPKVRAISFTGSRETGKWIIQNAGLKRVGLELGGKNGIIVMDDANLDLAVEGIIWGAFGTTGQRCTSASRIIVHEKVLPQLEKKLTSKMKTLKLGPGLSKTTSIGPLVNEAAVKKVEKYVEIGKNEGKLIHGGKPGKGKGCYFEPTLFTNVHPKARIAQEEIFGPVTALIPVKSLKEAIEVMNGISYGLSSSIYTADMGNAFKAIQEIETGITYVNSSTIGAEVHLPFGGMKETGNGTREAGPSGIEEFTEVKAVYIDYSGKLQKAQIDTHKK